MCTGQGSFPINRHPGGDHLVRKVFLLASTNAAILFNPFVFKPDLRDEADIVRRDNCMRVVVAISWKQKLIHAKTCHGGQMRTKAGWQTLRFIYRLAFRRCCLLPAFRALTDHASLLVSNFLLLLVSCLGFDSLPFCVVTHETRSTRSHFYARNLMKSISNGQLSADTALSALPQTMCNEVNSFSPEQGPGEIWLVRMV
jgi:hypothetical protein